MRPKRPRWHRLEAGLYERGDAQGCVVKMGSKWYGVSTAVPVLHKSDLFDTKREAVAWVENEKQKNPGAPRQGFGGG